MRQIGLFDTTEEVLERQSVYLSKRGCCGSVLEHRSYSVHRVVVATTTTVAVQSAKKKTANRARRGCYA